MVARTNSASRRRKAGPAVALTEYVPVTSGPARELTDADFDKVDARIDQLHREMQEILARLEARNAKPRRV
jgi:hypothetical protein